MPSTNTTSSLKKAMKMPVNVFDWMGERWLAGVAFIYTMVVVFDLLVLPFYYENREIVFSPDEQLIIQSLETKAQIEYLRNRRNYKPVSLEAGSIIHIAFGAVLSIGLRERNKRSVTITEDK